MFPLELSIAMETRLFILSEQNPYAAVSPVMLHILFVIGQLASESVGGQRTDGRWTIGILYSCIPDKEIRGFCLGQIFFYLSHVISPMVRIKKGKFPREIGLHCLFRTSRSFVVMLTSQ